MREEFASNAASQPEAHREEDEGDDGDESPALEAEPQDRAVEEKEAGRDGAPPPFPGLHQEGRKNRNGGQTEDQGHQQGDRDGHGEGAEELALDAGEAEDGR